MEELEKYLNKCYLEGDKEYVSVYKFVKIKDRYGFLCHDVQRCPENVSVYEDFPVDQEGELDFIKSFIPELDPRCEAKEISEGHYYELTRRIEKLNLLQETLEVQIKDFMKTYGLEQKV